MKSGRISAPVSPGNSYSYQGPMTGEMKVGSSRRSLEGLNQEVSSSFENCEFSTSPKVLCMCMRVCVCVRAFVCVCACVCVCVYVCSVYMCRSNKTGCIELFSD